MNQSTEPVLRRAAKRAFPRITAAASAVGVLPHIDKAAAGLNLISGQGAGSGWDDGEIAFPAGLLMGRAEPVVIDCGANSGEWTRGVRERLGSDAGTWLLIEPTDEYVQRLRPLTNVEVLPVAAGERREELDLYVPTVDSGWMSLHERRDTFGRTKTFVPRKVQVVPLGEELAARGIEHVDYLKMDIEGHELFVLRGLGDYLTAGKIDALSFEFGAANVNSRTYFRDFWELLTPAGYRISRIAPGGLLVRIPTYYETLEFFRGATNYVAVRE